MAVTIGLFRPPSSLKDYGSGTTLSQSKPGCHGTRLSGIKGFPQYQPLKNRLYMPGRRAALAAPRPGIYKNVFRGGVGGAFSKKAAPHEFQIKEYIYNCHYSRVPWLLVGPTLDCGAHRPVCPGGLCV